jgi:thiosulfate/3-mercaptopyruvate sulfurtransferase
MTQSRQHSPLISAEVLAAELLDPIADIVVCDCSFDLGDPEAGRQNHARGHIPGAFYVHLEEVLSGPKTGRNGRHPLPEPEAFAAAMAAIGVNEDTLIVAYDSSGGMAASRLWWLARWVGHPNVCVLDGGLQAWNDAAHELATDRLPVMEPGTFHVRPSLERTVDREQMLENVHSGLRLVIDARSPDRYRGENETLDPVGGHIPGAANRFFKDNLLPNGHFKPAGQLHAEFLEVFGDAMPDEIISQCGSGVTACHNLLAMEVAGFEGPALYPGSWSEWCAHEGAPVAQTV